LSRGFGPSGCPFKPLVSYQINRQLSGRNPPPLVTRAFGAHQNEPNFVVCPIRHEFAQADCSQPPQRTPEHWPDDAGRQGAVNALRHGLTAETIIASLEDAQDYQAFEANVIADYDAETAVERELVLRMASVLWRLRRATGIETALFEFATQESWQGPLRPTLAGDRPSLATNQVPQSQHCRRRMTKPNRPVGQPGHIQTMALRTASCGWRHYRPSRWTASVATNAPCGAKPARS
jgi:hypothetical protein